MNLHGIASPAIGAINPLISATVTPSAGYTVASDGTQQPTYGASVTGFVQAQELTQSDLQKVDGLNLQGVKRAVYLNGQMAGVVRVTSQGGDLIVFNQGEYSGQTWLVVAALEQWPDWVKVAVVLQNGS